MLREWSDELIEDTIKVFKPYADKIGESFTREDAVESMNNMVALFEILIEFDREQKKIEMPILINTIKQIQIKKEAVL